MQFIRAMFWITVAFNFIGAMVTINTTFFNIQKLGISLTFVK
jgi:hypothetical protein